ncbi:MAG: pilus assembly protein [Chloroflexi bacterium]|nr:pilus assembly protein [Chloroflexota bacterium]
MKRVVCRLQEEKGTGLVEFALMATVLAFLLFGIWDFGRVLDARIVATNAAREAARYGAVYGADQDLSQAEVVSQAQQKATEYLQTGLGTRTDIRPYSVSDIVVQFPNGRLVGEPVQVSVDLKVDVWPFMRQFFGGADVATIRGAASIRI